MVAKRKLKRYYIEKKNPDYPWSTHYYIRERSSGYLVCDVSHRTIAYRILKLLNEFDTQSQRGKKGKG